MRQERIIEQLEKMVASGRITPEERSASVPAAGTPEFDAVMAEIRARHAEVHTDAAVAAGRLSQEDADATLDRVSGGEHTAELRGPHQRARAAASRSRPPP